MQDAVDRKFVAEVLVDRARDLGLARKPQFDLQLAVQLGAHLVDRHDVVGVGDGDDEAAPFAVEGDRKNVVALRKFALDQLERRRIDHDLGQVDALQPELLREGVAQRGFGHEAQIDQQLADRLVGLQLFEQRDAQLVLGEDPLRNQDLADVALGLLGDGGRGCAG